MSSYLLTETWNGGYLEFSEIREAGVPGFESRTKPNFFPDVFPIEVLLLISSKTKRFASIEGHVIFWHQPIYRRIKILKETFKK